MAKTVKVEGRLISVPDDATPDEIDQIASGGQAPVKPPSFIDKTISNIPSSLGRVITHPYGEGMPIPVKENYARGEYPEQFQDVLPGIKRFVQHPIDATIGAVKSAVSEAPVETALGVAALGRQAMPETAGKIGAVTSGAAKGAFKDATEMVPFRRFGHEVSVPRPLLGAAAGELAGWMSHIPHAPVAGAIIGGVAPIIKGAYEGGKAALSDFRAAPVEPRIPAWMTESDINIKPNLSDVPVGPVGKPALPSGRVPGKMPVAAPETPQVQLEVAPGTLQGKQQETPQNAPKAQETAPEKSISFESKTSEQIEPDQWTWESLKDQHGQAAVDRVKAKYSDLADRIKASNMTLKDFLDLPQEMRDEIVKVPKHPNHPNRSKYSSGYNPKYENLFKELHGGE